MFHAQTSKAVARHIKTTRNTIKFPYTLNSRRRLNLTLKVATGPTGPEIQFLHD